MGGRFTRSVLGLAVALAAGVCRGDEAAGDQVRSGTPATPHRTGVSRPLTVGSGQRLLVIAPHPDDETLGAAGLIQRVLARRGTVRVVLVTAGDGFVEAVQHETGQPRPRPAEYLAYGELRLAEARQALRDLGGDRVRLQHLLGFPDGGLESLLQQHRRAAHPERSATTHATRPPYRESVHPQVRYDGDDLRAALARCVREFRPTIVAFPDPLDRHPDHRAAGLFALRALRDALNRPGVVGHQAPLLLAYLVHWPDWPPGWDAAVAVPQPHERLDLPSTLPPRPFAQAILVLNDREAVAKDRALAAYVSQQREMPALLEAFVRQTEPFTVFPPEALRRDPPMVDSGSGVPRNDGRE